MSEEKLVRYVLLLMGMGMVFAIIMFGLSKLDSKLGVNETVYKCYSNITYVSQAGKEQPLNNNGSTVGCYENGNGDVILEVN